MGAQWIRGKWSDDTAEVVIQCDGCRAEGTYDDIHASGWQLAPNRPFHYACGDCATPAKGESNG